MHFASTTKSVKKEHKFKSKLRDGFETSSMTSKSELSGREGGSIGSVLLAIQNVAKECNIYDLVFTASRMRADHYVEEKEFNKALGVYKFLKMYCKIADNLEGEMIMAEQLGHMYGIVKHHDKAADMFRIMLKLAWVLKDANMEIKSYGHLSREHFHLGNLEKSKYYMVRNTRGLLESDKSRMKNSIMQSYKDKINPPKNKKKKLNMNMLKKAKEPEILPSPSNDRHQ